MAKLHSHQHPINCTASGTKFMLADNFTFAGLGAGMWFWKTCLAHALDDGRVMINEKRTRASHFKPWSSCTLKDAEIVEKMQRNETSNAVVRKCIWTFQNTGRSTREKLKIHIKDPLFMREAPNPFKEQGSFWWLVHSLAFLAQPAESLLVDKAKVLRNSLSGANRVAALHVWRGDKKSESSPIPTAYYLRGLKEVLGNTYRNLAKHVRVVSDDESAVVNEVKEALIEHQLRFDLLPQTNLESTNRQWKGGAGQDIAEDLMRLQYSDPLVVSCSTNFGFLGMAMKISLDLEKHRSGSVFIIDPTKWQGRIALQPTPPNQSSLLGIELTFPMGCAGDGPNQISVQKPYEVMRDFSPPCSKQPVTLTWPTSPSQ